MPPQSFNNFKPNGQEQEKTIDDFLKKEDDGKPFLKPLRTYESDIAEIMKNKEGSLAKIAIAEEQKKEIQPPVFRKEEDEEDNKKKKRLVVGALILILLSFGVWGSFILFGNKQEELPKVFGFSPLFSADTQREVSIENKTEKEIVETLTSYRKSPMTLSTILGIYFVKGKDEEKKSVSGEEFLRALDTKASPALLRTFGGPVMYGIHSFKGEQPFLVLKTNHFENSFAGMLAWEGEIANDFSSIIPITNFQEFNQATSTQNYTSKRVFEDVIVKNKDARAIKDAGGNIRFMYSFPDRNTLIITTIPDTFETILSRLLTVKLVR